MDPDRIIEELTSGADLDSEMGRRQAYLRCLEHADRHLGDPSDYNQFVARAAERLGQAAVFRNVASAVPWTGRERLHLAYSPSSGPELTGNREGLAWLAQVLERLAQARLDGEHVRLLAGEPPLSTSPYPLELSLADDSWFDALEAPSGPASAGVPRRDIRLEGVRGFRLTGQIPPPLLMTSGKIYPVLAVEKLGEQAVWTKGIRPERDRVYVFEFRRDDGTVTRLGLDLDDEEVDFLTGRDL